MSSIDLAINNGGARELTMDEMMAVGGGHSLLEHVAAGAASGAATGAQYGGSVGAAVGAVAGAVLGFVEHMME